MSLPDSNFKREADPYKRCIFGLAIVAVLLVAVLVMLFVATSNEPHVGYGALDLELPYSELMR